MTLQSLRRAEFKTALKVFSIKVDVWIELTQCVPRGLTLYYDSFLFGNILFFLY